MICWLRATWSGGVKPLCGRLGSAVGLNYGERFVFRDREAEGTKRDAQFMVVEVAVFVYIKKRELGSFVSLDARP